MNKVAVVNRTNLKNYGSVLQCFALCKAVSELGYDSEIVWESGNVSKNFDFRPIKILKTAFKIATHPSLVKSTLTSIKEIKSKTVDPETVELFDDFVARHIDQKALSHKELVNAAKSSEYSKFICGSDQIWCSTTTYVDPLMYLRFAPKEKRIAYAPSLGRDYIPNYNRRQMKRYINEIPSISVREDDGQRLIKELTGRDAPVVLDPTLLVNKDTWQKIKNTAIFHSRQYILCYFLDTPSESTQKAIETFALKTNSSIISLGRKLHAISSSIDVVSPPCGPSEFISYVEHASTVITDSYHGMLFSMIFEREFWSIERAYQQFDQSSRQLTLLKRLGLKDRYLKDFSESHTDKLDYKSINNSLENLKRKSLEYLHSAIKG